MSFLAVKSSCMWLGLVGAFGFASEHASAEETPEVPATRAAELTDVVKNMGRRTWSILDAIEQHHIAAPSRIQLLKVIAPVVCGPDETSSLDKVVDEFGRCQKVDEFAAMFVRCWDASRQTTDGIEQLPDRITNFIARNGRLGHLRLMRAKDYAVEEQFRGNRYVGLGVRLGLGQGSQLPTFGVMPGGAAERGGVEDGAVILEVDRRSTRDVPIETLLDWLRGPLGSEVTLKIRAKENQPEREVTLRRGFVRLDSVFARDRASVNRGQVRFDPSEPIGYLHVEGIIGSTLQELRDAEVRLRADGIRVLVLDFRESGRSDDFHQARLVADGLLDGGTLWSRHERNAEPRGETADRECLFRGMPLIVLVDRSTGDAHTAIAAALQDAARAVIVGQSPGFEGDIATGVALSDEQHVLWMNTAKLTRSRADRDWPLKPDHVAGPEVTWGIDNHGRRRAMAPQPAIPPAADPAWSLLVENWRSAVGGGPVSALFPSNLPQNEIALRLRESAREGLLRQQQRAADANRLRETSYQAAQRIARELLKTLQHDSFDATNKNRNQASRVP